MGVATTQADAAAATGTPADSERLVSDAAARRAASRIDAAVAVMTGQQRRAARAALRQPFATVSDPRSSRPVQLRVPAAQSRALKALAEAGGADLRDAAQRLAQWADPVVSVRRLQHRLARTLPAAQAGEAAAIIARRVLCDSAGLVLRPGAQHAASFDAVAAMARAAHRCSDDVGIIDEDALTAWSAGRGWGLHLEDLAAACGYVRLSGRLAFRDNRLSATKAALLSLGGTATPDEIAHAAGRDKRSVAVALTACGSIIAVGAQMWAVTPWRRADAPAPDHADDIAHALIPAARALADDAGLIDRDTLAHFAEMHGWPDSVDALVQRCGFVTVAGMLSTKTPAVAAARVALSALGGRATTAELADAAAMKPVDVSSALSGCASVERLPGGAWRVTPKPQRRCSLSDADRHAGAGTARYFADDVGLVDEEALLVWVAQHELPVKASQLAAAFGLSRVRGRLALRVSVLADAKAGLLNRGRAATAAEVARGSRRDSRRIAASFDNIASVLKVGPRWIADTGDGALTAFVGAATSLTDDAGLIDESRLRYEMDALGWANRVDEMAAACGLVRVCGRLAVKGRASASVKAALLDLDRPAHADEIATITGIAATRVGQIAPQLDSAVTAQPNMWAAVTAGGGVHARFAAAVAVCRDEVGVIDEARLGVIAAADDWPLTVQHLARMWNFPRVHGRLVGAATTAATTKAALLDLRRPATLDELQEKTGYSRVQIYRAISGLNATMPKTGRSEKAAVSLS